MNFVTTRSGKQLVDPPLKEVTPIGSIFVDSDSNADEVDGKIVVNDDGNSSISLESRTFKLSMCLFLKNWRKLRLEKTHGKFLKH